MSLQTAAPEVAYRGQTLDDARSLYADGRYEEVIGLAKTIRLGSSDRETWFAAVLLEAAAESERGRLTDSLALLKWAGSAVDDVSAKAKARFYGQRAYLNLKINAAEKDGPLVDYEAARYWSHVAGDKLAELILRNNLARQYGELGRIDDAVAEVDAAISIATMIADKVNLGRCYDQKAQILLHAKHFSEAVSCSEKAIALLADHPAASEARSTYGQALIALGATYLENEDPIETFKARRKALEAIPTALDRDAVRQALARSDGHVLEAAQLLEVGHSALIRAIEKYGLERRPKRRRAKSLMKK